MSALAKADIAPIAMTWQSIDAIGSQSFALDR
jgi:hypothetical protein